MCEFDPIKLASNGKKSTAYFRHLRWSAKRTRPRCKYRFLYYFADYRFPCKHCRYKFAEYTGTYIGKFNFSLDILVQLISLFVLGVLAYTISFYVPVSLTTIEKTFRVFRESINKESLLKLKELKQLSGELEIDEALFAEHRKGKRGWGSEGESLVFGIYQRNGRVITFPISDRKHDTLFPLIKQHIKTGSLYYTDDHMLH